MSKQTADAVISDATPNPEPGDSVSPTPATEPAPEVTETVGEDQDDDGQESGNSEAAKWRRKLRDTEAERDQLRGQLCAQQRSIIDWRASTAQSGAVDPQLLDAAGITITDMLDDNGHLDMAAVDSFIDSTAVKFRVQRTAKPNPQQGNPSQVRTSTGLADAFDPKRHQ